MKGLFLGLAGAIVSLVLLIIDKQDDKRKKIILTLSSIGFLIVLGQQFLAYFSTKASDEIFEKLNERTKIIKLNTDNIETTVTNIDSTLADILSSRLKYANVEKIGLKVTSLSSLESLFAFDKGAPEAWEDYKNWLLNNRTETKSLRIVVDDNRSYRYSLLILYAMTDNDNTSYVREKINSSTQRINFPQPVDRLEIEKSNPLCDLVIFETRQGNVLGFAETKEFLIDLLNIKDPMIFEEHLNEFSLNSSFRSYATKNLLSFNIATSGNTLSEVGENMIKHNKSFTVSDFDEGRYFIKMSRLFQVQ